MISPPRLSPPRIALILLSLAVSVVYLAVEAYLLDGRLGFALDDSWIHLQFARSLALGEGLAYNPGERVAGSTAPLWTALLALVAALPIGVVPAVKLVGVALFAAVVLATAAAARELGLGHGLATLAGVLVATTDALVWSALSGMEAPLCTALSVGAVALHLRERRDARRPPLALPLFGLAALARPEGLLLVLLAALDAATTWRRCGGELGLAIERRRVRRALLGLGLAALVLLPTALVYASLGGSPLPTTYGAKASGGVHLPSGRALLAAVSVLMHPHPFAFLLAGGGVVTLVRRLGTRRDAGLLLAAWPLVLPLALASLSRPGKPLVGNFGRYLHPLFPWLVLVAVLALAPAAAALGPRLRVGGRRFPLRAVLLVLLLAPTALALAAGAARHAQSVANVADSDVRAAAWLRRHASPVALVAVQDIGAVKYLAPQRVLDVAGIVHPGVREDVARAVAGGDPSGARGMLRFLERARPDYLVVYDDWYPELTADRSRFRALLRLDIPGNITMASDALVVYTTVWNDTAVAPPATAAQEHSP